MEEKVRYAVFLAVVILVSVLSSYITTLALNPNLSDTNGTTNLQPSTNTNSTKSIVHALSYQADLLSTSSAYVTVTSDIPMTNLTIVYKYTPINGSAITEEVTYGDYFPVYDPGQVLQPGAHHVQNYGIPQNMVDVSSTKAFVGDNLVYVIPPQIQILDVYGYSVD